jgi:hypothetical protein
VRKQEAREEVEGAAREEYALIIFSALEVFSSSGGEVHLQPGQDEADPELRRCETIKAADYTKRVTQSEDRTWIQQPRHAQRCSVRT